MNFANVAGHLYLSLTTFRKNGIGVPTPVWFAAQGEKLYVISQTRAGKVQRVRNEGRVTIAPCERDGKVIGPIAEARARIVPAAEKDVAYRALVGRYGAQLTDILAKSPEIERSFIEITPI